MKKFLRHAGPTFKNSFNSFVDDKVLKLSAALAYYTIFSIGPLLLIVISLCSLFYGRDAVEGRVYGTLQQFTGSDTALQLQHIIKNAAILGKGTLAAVIGGITLVIGATSVFAEMQESIDMIWDVRPKPKKSWLKYLQNRFLSISLIIGLGFLLLVSLAISSLIESLSDHLKVSFPGMTVTALYIFNILFTFVVIVLLFAVIFKVLPDVRIQWKDVMAGAIVTALLFMLGKFGISFYIGKSHIGTTYGTAGALVVIMLWVYYSAIILYFGAEFTKAFALITASKIYPAKYAVNVESVEVENTGPKKNI